MLVNLKAAKARLSEYVEKASQGEEIWVTVRGKSKARICPLPGERSRVEKTEWLESVRETRRKYGHSKDPEDSQSLWDDLRGE